MTYNTEGIVLRYRDIGEFDRIYSILTAEHGKVDAWAQGVRKSQSKLVAHLQPLYLCDFMFARGRRFDRIAQVRVINWWASVWSDLEKMGQAMYAVSLVDQVLRPGTKESKAFELVRGVLEAIGCVEAEPPSDRRLGLPLLTLFSLKLLKESGFTPELRNCVVCKKEVGGLARQFDAVRGGVVCNNCVSPQVEAFLISSLTIETLETILTAPLARLEMPEQVSRELNLISDRMVEAHFGELPRSRMFVEALAKEPLYVGAIV